MPDVTWTYGATTVTFGKGIVRGAESYPRSGVVTDVLAGGDIVSYDLGVTFKPVLGFSFPHCTLAVKDAAVSFKEQTVRDMLYAFTHTDNSESPAVPRTVRLMELEVIPEPWTNPAIPRWTVRGRLQVEPAA